MRLLIFKGLIALAAAESVIASTWFGKTIYNKWHETELERWLSDNGIPYPTPSDRKDLENLIKDNWNDKVVTPYNSWDLNQLQKYITLKGEQVQNSAAKNRDSLVDQIKNGWTDTQDSINDAYSNTQQWFFDSWTESQLKAFCDRNGIPVPQPRTRDSVLKTVRENYQSVANKLGETASYPGDWLYKSWSDSDLKAWADERGIPVPQPQTRDGLIATVRRNSRIASNNVAALSSSAASAAAAATQTIADAVFDTWSDSQLKKWADERGIKVPQGSKKNELVALCRRHNARTQAEASKLAASAASAYGAATSSAGNEYAQATNDLALQFDRVKSMVFDYLSWGQDRLMGAGSTVTESASSASLKATSSASSASHSASKAAQKAYDSASENAQKVKDRAKEEL